MRFIEEHIKRLLGRETPPELDTDDLWASIAAGLPDEEDTIPPAGQTPVKSNRNVWLTGGALLLLLVTGITLWFINSPGNTDLTNASVISATEQQVHVEEQPLAASERTDRGKKNNSTTLPPSLHEPAEFSGPQPTASKSGITATGSYPISPAPPTSSSPSGQYQQPSVTEEPAAVNTSSNTAGASFTPSKTLRITQLDLNTAAAPPIVGQRTQVMVVPELKEQPIINRLVFNRTLPAVNVVERKFRSTALPRLSLALLAGGNVQFEHFTSNGDDVGGSLNQASGQAVGQSVGLDLQYRLNNHVGFSVGAEYHRTLNTFRHLIERDTMVPHPTPPNTGLVNATVRHSVAHNNRKALFSLPILLNYEQRFGNFNTSFGAGLSANYQLSASGRSLGVNGQFIRYETPLNRRFFLAYQFRPEIAWSPDPQSSWAFRFRLDVRHFNLGNATATGLPQKGWLMSGALGVSRSF